MTDCMVRGCSASSGSSLHYLPKDPELRQKWVDFIYKDRPVPDSVDRIRICSVHFTEGCFTNYRQKLMGFSKRLILTPTAVPTVNLLTDFTPEPDPVPDPGPKNSPDPEPGPPDPQVKTTDGKRDVGPLWLCPLCQQPKRDRRSLASHLTKKHSVLPSCLVKLLDSAAPIMASSDGEEPSTQTNDDKVEESSETPKSLNPPIVLIVSQTKGVPDSADAQKDSNPDMVNKQRKKKRDLKKETISSEKSPNKSDAQSDPDQLFKCDVCLEVFPRRSALNTHNNSPSHIERTKIVENDGELMRALLRRYVSYKPYQCDVCNVAYSHAITLESHLKSVLHQTRARSAAKAAKSRTNTGGKKVGGKAAKPPTTTENSSTKCQMPPTPLTPAQALSAYLPILSFTPSSLVPSVFVTPTNTSSPFIVKGRETRDLNSEPLAGPAEDTSGRSDASTETLGPPGEHNSIGVNEEVNVKIEIKDEPCEEEVSQIIVDDWTVAPDFKLELKEEDEDDEEPEKEKHVKRRTSSRKVSKTNPSNTPKSISEPHPEVHEVLQYTPDIWSSGMFNKMDSKLDDANLAPKEKFQDRAGCLRRNQKRTVSTSEDHKVQDPEHTSSGHTAAMLLKKLPKVVLKIAKTRNLSTHTEDDQMMSKKRKIDTAGTKSKSKSRGRRRSLCHKKANLIDDR